MKCDSLKRSGLCATRGKKNLMIIACVTIERAERGLVDADLGGGIIKQRVARTGQGRSGGYRILIAYRFGKRAVFLYGFTKSERDNIEADDLETLKEIGAAWLEAKKERLEYVIKEGILKEVRYEDRKK